MTLSWNQKRNTIGAYALDPTTGSLSWAGGEGNNNKDDFSIGGMGGKSGALGKNDFLGKEFDKANPWLQNDIQREKAKKEAARLGQERFEKTGGLNDILNNADTSYRQGFDKYSGDYLTQAGALVSDYTAQINALKKQSQDQATNAESTYTNSIQPEYKHAMELAKANADSAMTLEQAGDPNNPVQKAIRKLYDKQGQAARKQGQQDFGTLSALGAQAAQGQFGAAGPMTSGQMGQIYAQNQNQAGDAYAKAQQRMYDLQQQGIDKGFDQSNWLYGEGQKAQGRFSDTIKDFQTGDESFYDSQRRFRDEQGGYAGDTLGVNSALNSDRFNIGMTGQDIDRGNIYGSTGREQQRQDQLYGVQQQNINNDLQYGQANNASKGQFYSSLASMFTGGMGGAAGAAGGAAAGQIRRKNPNGSSGYAGDDGSGGYGQYA